MHESAKHNSVVVLRGRDTILPACWGKKPSVFEVERVRDVSRFVFVEGEARELLDECAEDDEVDVAVTKLDAGGGDRHGRESAAQAFFFA